VLPVEVGKRALVNGATGAIGSAAVQLLKNRGVDRTYGLEDIRDAFAYVASGQKIGSVVLNIGA